jgi:hypothetical protein
VSDEGRAKPHLARVGSGRSVRRGVAVVVAALASAVGFAVVDRLPAEGDPRPRLAVRLASPEHTPTTTAAATPTATAAAIPTAPRSDAASAFDRGNGWPPRPHPDSAAHFELRLLSYHVVLDEVAIAAPGGEASGRLAIAAETWQAPAWIELRWNSGTDERRSKQLAMVGLSLGSGDELGLPISLASGPALLPRPLRGTRQWHYVIVLERQHAYSAPDEWVVSVRLTAAPTD